MEELSGGGVIAEALGPAIPPPPHYGNGSQVEFFDGIKYSVDGGQECELRRGAFFRWSEAPLPYRQQPLESIGQVSWLVMGSDGVWRVWFRLFYFPRDTPGGKLPSMMDNEVLASWRRVVRPLQQFVKELASTPQIPTVVLSFAAYCRWCAEQKLEPTAAAAVVPAGAQVCYVRSDFRDFYLEGRDDGTYSPSLDGTGASENAAAA